MITAHLPLGYVTARGFAAAGPALWAGTFGGVLPDFDMIWFTLIDHRAFHHHHYWVHIPAFWAVVAALTLPTLALSRRAWLWPATAFFTAVFVHLSADSLAGGIKWTWPVSDEVFHLVTVPARYGHWVLNFVLHPVFVLAGLVWIVAGGLFVTRDRTKQEHA